MRRYIAIVGCMLIALITSCIIWESIAWKVILKRELGRCSSPNGHCLPAPTLIMMKENFFVPASVARILETHDRKELLSYLSTLRKSDNQLANYILDEWFEVVTNGLHGIQNKVRYTLNSKTYEIPVLEYLVTVHPEHSHP